ncbi:MAG: AtpZ/AtpI family protein [Sphingobacteriia bacterium]|nr:AtpZ/AtpI family protein [Sphingobacteriia bacterium]
MNNKFNELDKKIKDLKYKTGLITKESSKKDFKLQDLALEFFVITIVGSGFGYLIDSWLKTKPIFFLICLLFGVISGFARIYKQTK